MPAEPLKKTIAAAHHARERERLAALHRYGILDTPREPAFDDLATLASEICETPIAVVNLIADVRQWFKAEVGLGVRETPLESSFCAHAILESDYLEVPDATQDPRFDCNPLVTGEPGLRFYAGALLKSQEGLPIGTLCVLDTKPRRLSDWQASALKRLARQAMAQLELSLALRRTSESEERLRLATDAAEVGFWDVDEVNQVLHWPPVVKAMFGISADRPVSLEDFYKGLHPDDAPATAASYAAAADPARRALYEVEYRTIGKEDGVVRWVAAKGRGVFDVGGRCLRVVGTAVDITRRKMVDERLRELNETLERRVAETSADLDRVWRNANDMFVVIDGNGVFRRVNPAATKMLGWSENEMLGRSVFDFIHPDDVASSLGALEHARSDVLPTFENRYRTKDGGLRCISWVAAPEGALIYAYGRDVTDERARQAELEAAQEALRQSQKLEAVGQLTGGVAHDFNNLLTVIKSSTDLLKRPNLPEERRARYVGAISDTVDRAAKLTGQLLAFARRQALKPEVFDAAQSVRNLADMVGTLAGSRVTVGLQLPDAPCFVRADPSQFDTALVNMAVNARDAMNGEGQITVAVRSTDTIPAVRSHPQQWGRFTAVSITDTGKGISPENLERIFEPFFTTKEVGQGTGLGLSQVFGFAKQSGGDVTVDSAVGEGTTFTLYLPEVDDLEERTVEPESPAVADGHGTCVLVVEDNTDVGTFATQTLAELGYGTHWAASAEEALAELARDPDRFDVVFSDVVMPGMGGVELARQIRLEHAHLPVVLTSGYSHVLAQNGTDGFELLGKPYSVEELSRVLRRATRGRADG